MLIALVLLSLPAVRALDLRVDIAALYADRAGSERPAAPLVIAIDGAVGPERLEALAATIRQVPGVVQADILDPDHILREVVPEPILAKAHAGGWELQGLGPRSGLVVAGQAGRERELIEPVLAAVDQEAPDLAVYALGLPIVEEALTAQSRRDLPWLLGVAVGLMALGLALIGRTWRAVVLPLGAVALATTATMGIAGVIGMPLGGPNLLVPVVVLVFGVADSVYVVHAHADGKPLPDTLAKVALPCALTTGTTVISLLLLIPLTSPPLARFAALSAAGIALALVASLALPAIVLRLAPGPTLGRTGVLPPPALERWTATIRRRWLALSVVAAALAAPGLIVLPSLRPGLRLLDELPDHDPVRQQHERLTRDLGGLATLEVQVRGESPVGDPDLYEALLFRHAQLAQAPGVGGVLSFAEVALWIARAEGRPPESLLLRGRRMGQSRVLRAGHKALRGDDPRVRVWALPEGAGYRLHARMLDWDPDAWLEAVERVESTPDPPGVQTQTSGFVAVAAHGARRIPRDLWTSCLATCTALLVVMSLGLRSVRSALLGIVPALFATGVMAGALWLFDIGLTEAIVLAFALALGVGVDVWIHLALRASTLVGEGESAATARVQALRELLLPIAWTTGLLATGLAVLLTAGLATPRDVAVVVAPAFVIDVVATLVVFAMAWGARRPRLQTVGVVREQVDAFDVREGGA